MMTAMQPMLVGLQLNVRGIRQDAQRFSRWRCKATMPAPAKVVVSSTKTSSGVRVRQ